MSEVIEKMRDRSRMLELANDEFMIAVRRVAGPQENEIPEPDLEKNFEDYVELLKETGIKPDLSESSEGEEIAQFRRELQTTNESIKDLNAQIVHFAKQFRETADVADLIQLADFDDEMAALKKRREDLIESIKDHVSRLEPAAAFRVLEDSFREIKEIWKEVQDLGEEFVLETEASNAQEENLIEEIDSELDQLIKNDPLDA